MSTVIIVVRHIVVCTSVCTSAPLLVVVPHTAACQGGARDTPSSIALHAAPHSACKAPCSHIIVYTSPLCILCCIVCVCLSHLFLFATHVLSTFAGTHSQRQEHGWLCSGGSGCGGIGGQNGTQGAVVVHVGPVVAWDGCAFIAMCCTYTVGGCGA